MGRAPCISIHALLAESDSHNLNLPSSPIISIHALLAESDNANLGRHRGDNNFYPRSPCGERRSAADLPRPVQDFYPRSPCGERLNTADQEARKRLISIHALLAESDTWARGSRVTYVEFLSTLSLRRATAFSICLLIRVVLFLSTLSLRRATCYSLRHSAQSRHFYPRSPCGERPVGVLSVILII